MPSHISKPSQTEGLNLMFFTIPSSTLLQLGTGSLLIAMLGSRAVGQTLQALGEASEEVFRGDRLPILKFPSQTET